VRFTATSPRQRSPAIIGDTLRANQADFVARVLGGVSRAPEGAGPPALVVLKDGVPWKSVTVDSDDFTLPFTTSDHGRYRLQLQRSAEEIELVSSPIWFQPLPPRPGKGCGDNNHAHERAGECK
jgi:hypothetical protein